MGHSGLRCRADILGTNFNVLMILDLTSSDIRDKLGDISDILLGTNFTVLMMWGLMSSDVGLTY